MLKYYISLFLVAGFVLFYIFLQDPCNEKVREDFSDKYPGYNILSSGAGEGSSDRVQCHIYYQKPDSEQVYEDVWLYQDSGSGWGFSGILETHKVEPPA